ncbi:MAG: hypothetical protein K0R11_1132 [Acidimicrobiales bacterium]|nr:hypothetical protein [Acidimicrobiales bacterium]
MRAGSSWRVHPYPGEGGLDLGPAPALALGTVLGDEGVGGLEGVVGDWGAEGGSAPFTGRIGGAG